MKRYEILQKIQDVKKDFDKNYSAYYKDFTEEYDEHVIGSTALSPFFATLFLDSGLNVLKALKTSVPDMLKKAKAVDYDIMDVYELVFQVQSLEDSFYIVDEKNKIIAGFIVLDDKNLHKKAKELVPEGMSVVFDLECDEKYENYKGFEEYC